MTKLEQLAKEKHIAEIKYRNACGMCEPYWYRKELEKKWIDAVHEWIEESAKNA